MTLLIILLPWVPQRRMTVRAKVGRVYRRLCHRAILRHATLKELILIFWHFPIKLDPLITNMALVSGFGAPGRRRRHFKFGLMRFFTSKAKFRERVQAAGLAGLSSLPEFFLWRAKPHKAKLKMPPTPSRGPKTKNQGHFCDQHQILHKWMWKPQKRFLFAAKPSTLVELNVLS